MKQIAAYFGKWKVVYKNRYGLDITGELYRGKEASPGKEISPEQKHPALIIGAPYGGVKEQPIDKVPEDIPEPGAVVEDAEHIDLYDRRDRIPFDRLAEFFTINMQ